MVEPVAEDVGGPADLLRGDLTACGLVERVCAVEHAILDDPGPDCRSRVVRDDESFIVIVLFAKPGVSDTRDRHVSTLSDGFLSDQCRSAVGSRDPTSS
jgi:hypothetical protein